MARYFDTHAHYDSGAFSKDRDAVISSLPEKGVELVLCPGCDMTSSRDSVRLADRYPFIYAAVGIHPHYASSVPAGYLAGLEAMSHHPKVKAIGEIGLDYYRDRSPRPVQQDVFRAQMALALRRDLPVIIHDRDAHRDCLEVVRAYPGLAGVYHCYSGSLEHAKILVDMGWMLSFTGAVTFKNARRALEVLRWLPLEHIMIETDAPYLTPDPWRGTRNDSGYVYRVAEVIAGVKDLTVEEVAAATLENGKRFFNIREE